jgi:aryl sulfotransferase
MLWRHVMQNKHGIFWLASYPKSGNTWLRIVLYSVLNPSINTVNINKLATGAIASSRIFIDQILGFDSADLSNDEIDQLRPLIYQQHGQTSNTIQYHKIHDAYTLLDNGQPLIPTVGCLGAVYLIRNPLDVVGSFAHHSNNSIDQTIQIMQNKKYSMCKNNRAALTQIRHKLLSWSDHVNSWTNVKDFPVLIIRYEDLLQNPVEKFTQIVKFLQIECSESQIQNAIINANIKNLQQQEQEFGFGEKPPKAKSFFRKGVAGDWQNTLTTQQIAEIIDQHGEIMQQYGYL